ncbi:MAG TPA: hypothetical protein VFW07_01275 [Parafilimonas sp.]|nr:hypothetical protein [Parafilimonas sp.]
MNSSLNVGCAGVKYGSVYPARSASPDRLKKASITFIAASNLTWQERCNCREAIQYCKAIAPLYSGANASDFY